MTLNHSKYIIEARLYVVEEEMANNKNNGINKNVLILVIVLFIICYVVYKLPFERKYMPLFYILCFIFAGALGNFIDRVMYAYVVDFIYISLINFPIFNMADIYISIATTVLIVCLLFIYKEEDFKFIRNKK